MDNLNDLNNFLNEKKIVVKRRYTEAYPAKNVSTNARIRSVILDAISDGHITEEEMSKILTELQANKRWLGRNKTLFNISEDQAGIKTFSLSPYGQRVRNRTTPTVLNEALNVPHKEKGKKPVNMFVGRFQPFTLGHVKVFEKMYKENGLPVIEGSDGGVNNISEAKELCKTIGFPVLIKASGGGGGNQSGQGDGGTATGASGHPGTGNLDVFSPPLGWGNAGGNTPSPAQAPAYGASGGGGASTTGKDIMEVHYLSERCLVVQAANNFMRFDS